MFKEDLKIVDEENKTIEIKARGRKKEEKEIEMGTTKYTSEGHRLPVRKLLEKSYHY